MRFHQLWSKKININEKENGFLYDLDDIFLQTLKKFQWVVILFYHCQYSYCILFTRTFTQVFDHIPIEILFFQPSPRSSPQGWMIDDPQP